MGACFQYEGLIGTIDWIIGSLTPVSLTTIFNIILVVRAVYQKYKMQGDRAWRTTRKLTIQLLSISLLFLTLYLPMVLFALIRLWFDPSFLFVFVTNYFAYAGYLVPLLTPFVCLISLPEMITEIKKLFCCSNRVQPIQPQ
jgi:hypothetical protein